MLFAISYQGRPETRNAAIERFLRTGGLPPAGVKMIGRWHNIASISGVAVAECDDAMLMPKWALDWSDLFQIEVHTVLTDEQAGPLLAAAVKS